MDTVLQIQGNSNCAYFTVDNDMYIFAYINLFFLFTFPFYLIRGALIIVNFVIQHLSSSTTKRKMGELKKQEHNLKVIHAIQDFA